MCRRTALAGEGFFLNSAALFGELVHNGDDQSVDQKASRRLSEYRYLEALKEGDRDAGKATVSVELCKSVITEPSVATAAASCTV